MSWYPTIMILLAVTAIIVAYLIGKDHGQKVGQQKILNRLVDLGVIAEVYGNGGYVVCNREDINDNN